MQQQYFFFFNAFEQTNTTLGCDCPNATVLQLRPRYFTACKTKLVETLAIKKICTQLFSFFRGCLIFQLLIACRLIYSDQYNFYITPLHFYLFNVALDCTSEKTCGDCSTHLNCIWLQSSIEESDPTLVRETLVNETRCILGTIFGPRSNDSDYSNFTLTSSNYYWKTCSGKFNQKILYVITYSSASERF